MDKKKKKVPPVVSDALIMTDHIMQARAEMVRQGPERLLAKVGKLEPELASFIAACSKDIAAGALFDAEMSRPAAHMLRDRVTAMAITVFGSHHLAVYDYYKDMVKGTAVAALDAIPEPTPPAPLPPPPLDEGEACVD